MNAESVMADKDLNALFLDTLKDIWSRSVVSNAIGDGHPNPGNETRTFQAISRRI
jgi:hypothetical protein